MKLLPSLAVTSTLLASSLAFPFMASYPDMSPSQKRDLTVQAERALERRALLGLGQTSGAAAYSSKYPYSGAKIDGLPGSQKGGYLVPADGDTDHYYQDPPEGAQRGPCPGLNAAANHGFLSRDGITTFDELVAAQQNVYNVGWDLAVVLATAGVELDGDILTQKLSLGGLSSLPSYATGLNTHLKFEGDVSLTRNDYYTHGGDNFNFNGTLFGFMTTTCNKVYDRACMAKYRQDRWHQSQQENENFFFGPGALLLYGASSFLYELMPTDGGSPDFATISSFFGAVDNGDGTYSHVPERIPDNWRARSAPYTGPDVTREILAQYLQAPVLFGGNTGPGTFLGLDFGIIKSGKLNAGSYQDVGCLLQQFLLSAVPATVQNTVLAPVTNLLWAAGKLNTIFGSDFGCPAITPPSS